MDRRYSLPTSGGKNELQLHAVYSRQLSGIQEKSESPPKSPREPNRMGDHDVVQRLQPPPDGGYGWLIVFSSFLCNFFVDGTAFTFGIFFDAFLLEFGGNRATTSLAGSLLSGCYLSAGPLVSSLIHRYECRPVAMAGAILGSLSLAASAFAPNQLTHLLTYGICSGITLGLIYLPAIVVVSSYFDRKRAFATGLSLCGTGLGAFAYAPFSQVLLAQLGLRKAIIVLAAIIAIGGTISASLMKPLRLETHILLKNNQADRKQSVASSNYINNFNSNTHLNGRERKCGAVLTQPLATEVKLEPTLGRPLVQVLPPGECSSPPLSPSHSGLAEKQRFLSPDMQAIVGRLAGQRTISECYSQSTGNAAIVPVAPLDEATCKTQQIPEPSSELNCARTMLFQKRDIFYSGSVYRLSEGEAPSVTESVRCSLQVIQPDEPGIEQQSVFKQMLDISLFSQSRPFTLLAISNFIAMMGFYIPFMYLTQHVKQNVFDGPHLTSGNRAVLLLSFVGITNTLGRLLFGWISDQVNRPYFRRHRWLKHITALSINNACLMLSAFCIAIVPLLSTYNQMTANCFLLGLCCAAYMCLTSIILVDLLGLDKLTNAYGLISMCRGVGSMIGPPLAGFLVDLLGTYNFSFYLAGAQYFIAACLSYSVYANLKKV